LTLHGRRKPLRRSGGYGFSQGSASDIHIGYSRLLSNAVMACQDLL
jgi:hypothetical protein